MNNILLDHIKFNMHCPNKKEKIAKAGLPEKKNPYNIEKDWHLKCFPIFDPRSEVLTSIIINDTN